MAILNCMSQVFKLVTCNKEADLQLDNLLESLDCYLDKENESICLSKFLYENCEFLFAPSNHFGSRFLKFWSLLLQLLLQPDGESCITVCLIVKDLKIKFSKNSDSTYDYDVIAMNKLALDIFIEFYIESMPYETIKFLLDQYELVCEFDSSSIENEVSCCLVFFVRFIQGHFLKLENFKSSFFFNFNCLEIK